MKTFLITFALLTSSYAFSCPYIAGSWMCYNNPNQDGTGYIGIIKIKQTEVDGLTHYKINGQVYIANGQELVVKVDDDTVKKSITACQENILFHREELIKQNMFKPHVAQNTFSLDEFGDLNINYSTVDQSDTGGPTQETHKSLFCQR